MTRSRKCLTASQGRSRANSLIAACLKQQLHEAECSCLAVSPDARQLPLYEASEVTHNVSPAVAIPAHAGYFRFQFRKVVSRFRVVSEPIAHLQEALLKGINSQLTVISWLSFKPRVPTHAATCS
ncbi:hypothetical protein FRIGORI9N_400131 [Frigoribacterium sp. 9N]|nr:hypothetical protein FRIGORI9N_400131 [Frigoribacterium sp. 9N]